MPVGIVSQLPLCIHCNDAQYSCMAIGAGVSQLFGTVTKSDEWDKSWCMTEQVKRIYSNRAASELIGDENALQKQCFLPASVQ